ncbi:protein bfr2 [Diospyros lotus]|uniref:protein bfr2 n=1 Tax=Diospyros lotus TaxID=55363 RepID=UPI002252ADA9|nr:protein bfr2 [Diospyros lotus]
MNATSDSASGFIEEDTGGSDSDGSPEYYQPISAGDGDEDVSYQSSSDLESYGGESSSHPLANGYAHGVVDEISSINLSDDEERKSSDDDAKEEEEEEEEMRMREASDSAILRAFREDESRRNAPLPAETASRVMEAMRGVSFSGSAPVWADRVPEDQWINQLRRLRRPQTTVNH